MRMTKITDGWIDGDKRRADVKFSSTLVSVEDLGSSGFILNTLGDQCLWTREPFG